MELMYITGHIITLSLRIDEFYSIIELYNGVCKEGESVCANQDLCQF